LPERWFTLYRRLRSDRRSTALAARAGILSRSGPNGRHVCPRTDNVCSGRSR
jgi:hypothetical protein